MTICRGSKVWLQEKELAWVPADVVDFVGKNLHLITDTGNKIVVSPEDVCPRDPDAEEHGGVDDMTKLTYLNEPGVLYNLRRRYALNDIYTYTGNILIAVNPFTRLYHLYNLHMMKQYNGVPFGQLSPHVFAVADASYRAMINEGKGQSILVSGESGAGKTETTKLIMQYLAFVGGHSSGEEEMIEQQVLESNPLLQAFGNAKTARNDNSSRFGKFVDIQFDPNGRISGAVIRTYLLERSRVVQITDPERNYHCFYQLCASQLDAAKFKLGHPSNFHYLNQSKSYELDGMDDADGYMITRRAMDIVGISHADQESLFRTLAGILHLGNIGFSPGKAHDSSEIRDEKSYFHLQMTASLFMCDIDFLKCTLCTRSIQTHEGCIIKALDCNSAVNGRDALAKTIYSHLFEWIVEKINTSIGQDPNSHLQIGVLDIYGFECFECNSFEQFCINFANEKLQQHFNEHVLKMEQDEYQKEEISWSYIEFIDNQDVLDLIEKKPVGIITLLDEACMFPKSTHETFSSKIFGHFEGHKRLKRMRFSREDFCIAHYAGKVTYQTRAFLDKNRDYLILEHLSLLSSSKCSLISALFCHVPEESLRSSYKFSSVASRFKIQLQALMETLNKTEPSYIRCVKPNSENKPHLFENMSVLHQLRCGGILEALRISLAGYPTRRTYSEFVYRYGLLALELLDKCYDDKRMTEMILQNTNLDGFQMGKTKVFLRAGQIGLLDSKRYEKLNWAARLIQEIWKTFVFRNIFLKIRSAAFVVQAHIRGGISRRRYMENRQTASASLIQKHIRGWLHRNNYTRLCSATNLIQSKIRYYFTRQIYLQQRRHRCAIIIQTYWRMHKAFSYFLSYRYSVMTVQCLWRRKKAKKVLQMLKQEANETGALRLAKGKLQDQLEDLTWRWHLEKNLRVTVEEAKLAETLKLKKTVDSLHAKLNEAKTAFDNEHNKNIVLENQLEMTMMEKSILKRELVFVDEIRKENMALKGSLDTMERNNFALQVDNAKANDNTKSAIGKLLEVENNLAQLRHKMQSLEERLSNLQEENLVLQTKALRASTKTNSHPYLETVSEKYGPESPVTYYSDRNSVFESPTPSKIIANSWFNKSEKHMSKTAIEKNEENKDFLLRCIREDLGFCNGKPVAACILYKCFLHWHSFESKTTSIFHTVMEAINETLKVGDENVALPYWLSNFSALLCLLQRNLKTTSLLTYSRSIMCTPSSLITGRASKGQRLTPRLVTFDDDDDASRVDVQYPTVWFKQQLIASIEKVFRSAGDNLKKSIAPLLNVCIQAPQARPHPGKSSRSPANPTVPSKQTSPWNEIIQFLSLALNNLHTNHVPSFLIRKLLTQVFSVINMTLFNGLLMRRGCCTFSNGEYVKSGLCGLEKWTNVTTEQFAGPLLGTLDHIRQAVSFLVIHQKRKKSLKEIVEDLCPSLTLRQIYRISTMYFDDKYGTESVSNEVVDQMRQILNSENVNPTLDFFLCFDDPIMSLSIEEMNVEMPEINASDIQLPTFVSEYPSLKFLIPKKTGLF